MLNKAYSLVEIKSVNEDLREIEGFASTPAIDHGGDTMDPAGAEFKLPHPLLWQHKHEQPIGQVIDAKVTSQGIWIKARIAAGVLPRIDEAWALIKAGLVGGFSIGWRPKEATRAKDGFGLNVKRWLWLETSAVTIPMNSETTIALIKSIDDADLAASGQQIDVPPTAGVTAPVVRLAQKGARSMTYQERIKSAENTLAEKQSMLTAIQVKVSDENRTKDASERESFDAILDEIKKLDEELVDLRAVEAISVKSAVRVVAGTPAEASQVRGGSSNIVVLKPELAKGTLFTRYAMAVAAGKGSYSDTLQYAKRWDPQTPEVSAYIKAQEGSTGIGSPTWGTELVYAQNLVSEFVELLRAATVVDKLTGLRRVPFNVRIPVQTGGSNVNWVGEAAPKPVTELAFDEIILEQDKIAGIVVLTEELIRLSSPNAEEVVRRDLVEQIARFIDVQFLTPGVSVTENNPASVTNGVSPITGSGSTADDLYADLNAALAQFDDNEMGEASIHIVMPPSLARGISSLRNALGQFEFRDVSRSGGTLMGFPVIVSSSTPSGTIIIVKADEILMADDGRVTLDASNQATIDMNGGHNPTFNLWQRNCVGIRAERWITWKKRRSDAVALIQNATYGPPVGS